jgi:hypothetical protein
MNRKYTLREKVWIAGKILLGIPVALIILLFLWKILIDLGFDVAPR